MLRHGMILLGGLSSAALSTALPPTRTSFDLHGSRIFSNLCVQRVTGDVDGLRLFVRPIHMSPRVIAQFAEGGLLEPVPASSKPIAGGLSVTVPGDIPEATFVGTIIANHATFRSRRLGDHAVQLAPTKSASDAPYCK